MGLALIITALLSAILGLVFGNTSTTMTKPMSDSFVLYGTVFPGVIGFIVGIIAAFCGEPVFAALAYPTILGLVVGGCAVALARYLKGR